MDRVEAQVEPSKELPLDNQGLESLANDTSDPITFSRTVEGNENVISDSVPEVAISSDQSTSSKDLEAPEDKDGNNAILAKKPTLQDQTNLLPTRQVMLVFLGLGLATFIVSFFYLVFWM